MNAFLKFLERLNPRVIEKALCFALVAGSVSLACDVTNGTPILLEEPAIETEEEIEKENENV